MQSISNLLSKQKTISFEFFAPKEQVLQEKLLGTIKSLKEFTPSFVSVTYSINKNSGPTDIIVKNIAEETTLPVMPHLTCITHTQHEIDTIINLYKKMNLGNILALRGDLPEMNNGISAKDFKNALQLVNYLRQDNNLDIAVAAHPEGHPDAIDQKSDLHYQQKKINSADFAITQFFFEAEIYLKFIEKLNSYNVTTPVIPGLMPPTNLSSLIKMSKINGSRLPKSIKDKLEKLHTRKETEEFAIEITVNLAEKLIANGAPGIHLYTMNNLDLGNKIAKEIKL
jgi:methylenetetrahydrofolate reductase (NADPH)